MKKIDGITLLQKIKNEELTAETKIKVYYDDGIEEYLTTIYFDGLDLKWQPKTFHVRYLYDEFCYFEIIEERPEEIEEWGKISLKELEEKELDCQELQMYLKIAIETQNEIIKEVNLLKKEDEE